MCFFCIFFSFANLGFGLFTKTQTSFKYVIEQISLVAIKSSLRIGNIFGIPVHLHWTLLFVVAWVIYDGYLPDYGFRWERIGWISGVIGLLFSFVFIHELGHALSARYFGKPTQKILLFPLGGGAYIPEHPKEKWQEILVYAGGPLANLGLALLALPAFFFVQEGWLLLRYYFVPNSNVILSASWWEELLCLTVAVNVVLAVLNLLPAYPLDGGRILQALLRGPLGERRATVIVSVLGVIAGIGFIFLAWNLGDPILGAGGLFVGGIAAAELNNGWQRRRLQKYQVADVVRPVASERLYLNDSVNYARQQLERSGWPVLPVYDTWNDVSGFLAAEVIDDMPHQDLPETTAAICDPALANCLLADNLLDATVAIIEADSYGAIVYDRQRPVGFLLMDDIMEIVERRF